MSLQAPPLTFFQPQPIAEVVIYICITRLAREVCFLLVAILDYSSVTSFSLFYFFCDGGYFYYKGYYL